MNVHCYNLSEPNIYSKFNYQIDKQNHTWDEIFYCSYTKCYFLLIMIISTGGIITIICYHASGVILRVLNSFGSKDIKKKFNNVQSVEYIVVFRVVSKVGKVAQAYLSVPLIFVILSQMLLTFVIVYKLCVTIIVLLTSYSLYFFCFTTVFVLFD